MRRTAALLSSVAFLTLAQPASAQTTTGNRADFSGNINWSSGFINTPAGSTTVSASSNGVLQLAVAGISWGGGFTDGDALLFDGGGSFMQFDFASAISGFGTQAWFNYFSGSVVFQEYLGSTLKGSWSYGTGAGGGGNNNQATFFGVLDNSGFDRVVMTGNAPGFQEFAINDVAINATTTPEPASLALLGSGLVAVFGVARRRRNSNFV